MKTKKIIALLMCITMILSLAACAKDSGTNSNQDGTDQTSTNNEGTSNTSTGNTDTDPNEKVTLRMAWWGSQTRHDRTVAVIELYESLNPNVDIEYEFFDFDGYFTKLNTLVASNNVWDIFQLGGNFPTYLEKIVTLDDYIANGTVDISNTTEGYLQTTKWEGKQLALSSGVNSYGIAYDPALFQEAGVAEPTENWTWEDFKNACLTIHEKLGIYGSSKLDDFISGASMGISQEGFEYNFFASTNDKLGFSDPSMLVDYLAMRKELVEAGAYPDPGAIAEIKDIEGDYLVTGDAAMTWVASNQLAALVNAAGREIKIVPAPRKTADGPSGTVIQSSQMLCISKDSKVPEEAAKFINFFINSEEANAILLGERGVPIMSNVRDMLQKDADDVTKLMYSYLDLVGSFETGGEVNVISPEQKTIIEDQYKLLIEQVIYGDKTPEDAANEIFNFANEQFTK